MNKYTVYNKISQMNTYCCHK